MTPSHLSTIKTVVVFGSATVSGGNDDTINIYDLSTSTEIISLHSAAITSLAFYSPPSLSSFPRNLVSGDVEGGFSIYDADPFFLLKSVKIHKKSINSISVYPSRKLALTIANEECLAIFNLVRGRRSFYCKIVHFDKTGDKFYIFIDEKVGVNETEDSRLIMDLENKKNFTRLVSKALLCHRRTRVIRGARILKVASSSSDGVIRVWDLRMANKEKTNLLTETNTKSRLTCLVLQRPQSEARLADEGPESAAAVES